VTTVKHKQTEHPYQSGWLVGV